MAHATDEPVDSLDAIGGERVGVVAHHLFQPKSQQGVFLPLESINEKQIARSLREVQKQKKEESGEESEGVVKELQIL
jgi:hypothetical protein